MLKKEENNRSDDLRSMDTNIRRGYDTITGHGNTPYFINQRHNMANTHLPKYNFLKYILFFSVLGMSNIFVTLSPIHVQQVSECPSNRHVSDKKTLAKLRRL